MRAQARRAGEANKLTMNCQTKNNGFSLLEVLLVIGIVSVLATASFGIYYGFIAKSDLDMAKKNIVFTLKQAQGKAMAGEDGRKWGVHFVNGASDYYELFSTPTDYNDAAKVINATTYLPGRVFFTEPASSSDIIFEKIRGTVAAAASVIISSPENQTSAISVSALGNIY